MKVKDLIAKLKELDQEADVYIPSQWYGEDGSYGKVEVVRTEREYTTLSKVELGFV